MGKGIVMPIKHVYEPLVDKQDKGVGVLFTLGDGTTIMFPERIRFDARKFQKGDLILLDLDRWNKKDGWIAHAYCLQKGRAGFGVTLMKESTITSPVLEVQEGAQA